MNRFADDQRVLVKQTEDGIAVNAVGTVHRICTDGSAWIALDHRSKQPRAHQWPAKDKRGTHVRAYPDDCELAQTNAKERRTAARGTKDQPPPTVDVFGRDHWSTFLYIETCVTDQGGKLDRRRMRCDADRHPLFAHLINGLEDDKKYPTRLRDGKTIANHDDWDCADDLERVGLVENIGTGANRCYLLTELGWTVASLLRQHKATGAGVASFVLTLLPGTAPPGPHSEPATIAASCPPATR